MLRNYYLVWIRSGGRDLYAIWSSTDDNGEASIFSNDLGEDRLLFDDTGLLKHFPNVESARQFAEAAHIRIVKERLVLHDLDQIEQLMANADVGSVPHSECLNAWNLYVDLARSASPQDVGFLDVADDNLDLYDKLFEGTDIPAHHKALPVSWTHHDLARLRKVLFLGQKALSRRLRS